MTELGVWLGLWRDEFAAADELGRIQVRARLARLVAVERESKVHAALKDLLEEMRLVRSVTSSRYFGGPSRNQCHACCVRVSARTQLMRSRDVKKLYQDFLFYVGGAAVNRILIAAHTAGLGDTVLPWV
jgi:hypothetical protein